MSEGKLPANIRQIGTIDDSGINVYVEDFVCTYLRQLAESGGKCETLAYLVGKTDTIDGRDCVFISGAVAGKHSKYIDGMESFTEKSEKYAEDMLKLYFPGYEIVGWMQSQPGYGCAVNPAYADAHMERFTKPFQVLFVMDPVERLNAFYAWDASMSGLSERGGYIIYYDKNDGMREYMLDNKLTRSRGGAKPAAGAERETSKRAEAAGAPAKRKEGGEYRRVVNMLVSLSAVLFIICFIMAAGLIQADGRVTKLENEVAGLDATYGYLAASVKNGATQEVFAPAANTPAEADLTFTDTSNGGLSILQNASQTDAIAALEGAPEVVAENGEEDDLNIAVAQKSPKPEAQPAAVTPPSTPAPSPSVAPNAQQGAVEDPNAVTRNQTDFDTYIVEQGDSLLSISWKFYGSPDRVNDIMELNNIAEADVIFYGKKLKLPK